MNTWSLWVKWLFITCNIVLPLLYCCCLLLMETPGREKLPDWSISLSPKVRSLQRAKLWTRFPVDVQIHHEISRKQGSCACFHTCTLCEKAKVYWMPVCLWQCMLLLLAKIFACSSTSLRSKVTAALLLWHCHNRCSLNLLASFYNGQLFGIGVVRDPLEGSSKSHPITGC